MPNSSSVHLPTEILSTIFFLLPPSHVFTSANRVCKAWNESARFLLDESGKIALDVTLFSIKESPWSSVQIPRFKGHAHTVHRRFQRRVYRTARGTVVKGVTAGSVDVWASLPFLELVANEPGRLGAEIATRCGRGLEHLGVKAVIMTANDFSYDWKSSHRTSLAALSTFFRHAQPVNMFVRYAFAQDWANIRLAAIPSVRHVKCWEFYPGTSCRALFDAFPNLASLSIDPIPPNFAKTLETSSVASRSGLTSLRAFNHPKAYPGTLRANEAILFNAVTQLPNVTRLGVLTLDPGIWNNHVTAQAPEQCLHGIRELQVRVVPHEFAQFEQGEIETMGTLFSRFCPALEMLDVVFIMDAREGGSARLMDGVQTVIFLRLWDVFCRVVHVSRFRVEVPGVSLEVRPALDVRVDVEYHVSRVGVFLLAEVKDYVSRLGKRIVENILSEWEL